MAYDALTGCVWCRWQMVNQPKQGFRKKNNTETLDGTTSQTYSFEVKFSPSIHGDFKGARS
jgi:hypothetical protein